MMDKDYFTRLDDDARTELTCNYGEQIVTVETPETLVCLFLLDQFFVELQVDKLNNELIGVRVQDDPDILYAYISDLDISHLFD